MRLVLDGKSLLVGGFAGAALVASLGAMQNGEPQVGRFQIDAEPDGDYGTTAYVVDTATGRMSGPTSLDASSPAPTLSVRTACAIAATNRS